MMVEDVKIKDVFCRIYRPNTKPTEVVIMVHGFAGDKESSVICALGEELSNSGIQVVSFDLPCHGADVKNEYVNATDCMLALTKVVNYVEEEFDTLKISFFATSFGGYLLLNFLSKPDFINYEMHSAPLKSKLPVIYWTVRTEEQKNKLESLGVNFVFESVTPSK